MAPATCSPHVSIGADPQQPGRLRLLAWWLARVLLVLSALAAHGGALAEERIRVTVGGYPFPPYVEVGDDGMPSGLALELIEALNRAQSLYRFEFYLTAPRRRFLDFLDGRFDLIFFESLEWGWSEHMLAIDHTPVLWTDTEVFIARAEPGRDQSYFGQRANLRIAGMLGYHYAFADYVGDPELLRTRFDITLVETHPASIELVLHDRVDIAIVTRSYLDDYLARRPELRRALLISQRVDQVYALRTLVRNGVRPTAAELLALLDRVRADPALARLWHRPPSAR